MKLLPGAMLIALLTACNAEWLPFPAGELEGTVQPTPQNWEVLAAADIIQLETRSEDPYSVNLWVVNIDGTPHVHAGANETAWVTHIRQDPNVRLGHDGAIYLMRAEQVTDQATFDRYREGQHAKYDAWPRSEEIEGVYVYRLTER